MTHPSDGRSGCRRGGGVGRGAGRGQGTGGGDGRGVLRRRRDGSVAGRRAGASAPLLPATAMRRVARLDEPDLCIGCGTCVDACPPSAIRIDEIAVIHKDVCTGCGECVEACPRGVLSLVEA